MTTVLEAVWGQRWQRKAAMTVADALEYVRYRLDMGRIW